MVRSLTIFWFEPGCAHPSGPPAAIPVEPLTLLTLHLLTTDVTASVYFSPSAIGTPEASPMQGEKLKPEGTWKNRDRSKDEPRN